MSAGFSSASIFNLLWHAILVEIGEENLAYYRYTAGQAREIWIDCSDICAQFPLLLTQTQKIPRRLIIKWSEPRKMSFLFSALMRENENEQADDDFGFPPALLTYNWHVILRKFKVYNVILW